MTTQTKGSIIDWFNTKGDENEWTDERRLNRRRIPGSTTSTFLQRISPGLTSDANVTNGNILLRIRRGQPYSAADNS